MIALTISVVATSQLPVHDRMLIGNASCDPAVHPTDPPYTILKNIDGSTLTTSRRRVSTYQIW